MTVARFQALQGEQHSLDGRIVTYIRDLVERGELVQGDRLPPERELAVQLGVSRTALREALHTLAALGLVQLRHGRGVFITSNSGQATAQRLAESLGGADSGARVRDLFEIRRELEGAAAGWAAERATAEQLAEMRTIVGEAESACACDPIDATLVGEIDSHFHAIIAASAANRTLVRLMATLLEELALARAESLAIPGRAQRSVRQHVEIVKAIAEHNPEVARARMLAHLCDVEQSILSERIGAPEA